MSALRRSLPLAWILAWRYLRGRRSRILASTATAALVATTLGVTAMVVAMALMSGYTDDLRRKLIGLQGEVLIQPLGFELDLEEAVRTASSVSSVALASQVSYGEGSIAGGASRRTESVVLRGVEPASLEGLGERARLEVWQEAGVTDTSPLSAKDGKPPGVILGKELIRRLGVEPGDPLRLIVLSGGGPGDDDRGVRFFYRSVRAAGSFTTGFAEFDSRWMLLDRELLVSLRGDLGLDAVEVDLMPGSNPDVAVSALEQALGLDWSVRRWESLNRQLFAALALQETLLFLVLGLIVLVSTFNVASTLIILVRERTADIGVLSALGLEPRQLWAAFVVYGLGLGMAGTALGITLGAGASWVITEFELIRFDPEVAAIYFIEAVPFSVEAGDLMAIALFSMAVTFLACALPARRAASISAADALRDE